MKNPTEIGESLNRDALPAEVDHINDDVFGIVERCQKHLNEYKNSIPKALATQFPDLVKELYSQIETINTAIEAFIEEILRCEVPVNQEALIDRTENYSVLVDQFTKLLSLEKQLKTAVKLPLESDRENEINLNGMQKAAYADRGETEVLQYFIENVALDPKMLPVKIYRTDNDACRMIMEFREYLEEFKDNYQKNVSGALLTQFPNIFKKYCLKIEEIWKICVTIEVFLDPILEDSANQEVLDSHYSKLVKQFDELLSIEKQLKTIIKLSLNSDKENEFNLNKENELNLNKAQKRILYITLQTWFDSILTSFSALDGLKAIFDEKIFEENEYIFRMTGILDALAQIKAVLDHSHPQNGSIENVSICQEMDVAKNYKELLAVLSLCATENWETDAFIKQDISSYTSKVIKDKISQLEKINFDQLTKELPKSIEANDFERFKNIITVLKNNKIPLDSCFYAFSSIYSIYTPLTYAAEYGRVKMVELLLVNHVDPNFRPTHQPYKNPALTHALGGGISDDSNITTEQRCEIIKMLVKSGASLGNIAWDAGRSRLYIPTEILRLLLELGAEKKDLLRQEVIATQFRNGIRHHDKVDQEKLLFLQSHGIDFYKEDDDGMTIVDRVLSNYGLPDNDGKMRKDKNISLIKFLFDIYNRNHPSFYHLKYVTRLGQAKIWVLNKLNVGRSRADTQELVEFIENYHAQQKLIIEAAHEIFDWFPDEVLLNIILHVDVTSEELTKFLQLALVCTRWRKVFNDLNIFKKIVEEASANQLVRLMKSSCLEGSAGKVAILLASNRITANYQDNTKKTRRTPLHYACISGSVEVAALLLNNEAEVTAIDLEGNSPLHLAAAKDNVELCGLLLQFFLEENSEEQVNAGNYKGNTSLHMTKSVAVAELLIMHRAKVKIENKEGKSPLFRAVGLGLTEVVACLIKYGANVDDEIYGSSLLELAVGEANLEIIKLLLVNGANSSCKKSVWVEEGNEALISERFIRLLKRDLVKSTPDEEIKITRIITYLKTVKEKDFLFFSAFDSYMCKEATRVLKDLDLWFFMPNSKRSMLKVTQNEIYQKIFEEDLNVEKFRDLMHGPKGMAYIKTVEKKCLIIHFILQEADRIQGSYLYKGKEKATAIRTELQWAFPEVVENLFAENCSVDEFEDLILNTSNILGKNVKKALALDFTPGVIGSIVSALGFFGGDKDYDQHGPQNSSDKSFTP